MGAGRAGGVSALPTAATARFPPLRAAAPHGIRARSARPWGHDSRRCASRHEPPALADVRRIGAAAGRRSGAGRRVAGRRAGGGAGGRSRTAPHRSEPAPAVDTTWRDPAPSSPSRSAKRWSTSAEVDSNSYRLSLSRGQARPGRGLRRRAGPCDHDRAQRRSRQADRSHPAFAQHRLAQRHRRPAAEQPDRARRRRRDPSSTRRVGLEWKPVQSRVFVRGGLGVRLVGDDQLTMKLRAGQIGLYMKSSF